MDAHFHVDIDRFPIISFRPKDLYPVHKLFNRNCPTTFGQTVTMKYMMFTKHLEDLDLAGVAEALGSVGVDGADLCVRPGYPVDPENIQTALPEAAQQFADAGLSIPMVTGPGDFTTPDLAYSEDFYGVCGEVGVKHISWGTGPGIANSIIGIR